MVTVWEYGLYSCEQFEFEQVSVLHAKEMMWNCDKDTCFRIEV